MSDNILIFIYIFLDVLPFAIPRYYLFLDRLALPVKWLVFLLISISVLEAFGFIYLIHQPWCIEVYLLIYRYIFIFIFAVLSFIIIKDYFPKVIFIYLLMLSYGAFVVGNSHFIESRFFPLLSKEYPYLINNITKLTLLIITFPILFYFLENYIKKVMNVINSDIWKYIWIIPLIFCAITAIYSPNYSKESAADIHFILLRYLNLIGVFFISFILLKTLKQTEINTRLQENIKHKKNQLNMQKEQYLLIASNIEETKKARHDLRHHISLLQSFLNDKEYEKLKNYIDTYENSLPIDNDIILCENYVVNAILCHYVTLAKKENIAVDVNLRIPADTFITDLDFCIILGNCLENAIEACMKITKGEKFISVKSQMTNYMIGLTIDNSFSGEILKENNDFISTKKSKDHGIGISSIHAVASKYDGTAKFEFDALNNIFKASILLNNNVSNF